MTTNSPQDVRPWTPEPIKPSISRGREAAPQSEPVVRVDVAAQRLLSELFGAPTVGSAPAPERVARPLARIHQESIPHLGRFVDVVA
jgi:hypothetical protein